MNLIGIKPFVNKNEIRIVIETPQGSRNKIGYDPELKAFRLHKTLPEGMVFPYHFGFIPQTQGEDGDPLDALVLMPEPLAPGCLVDGRLIGVIRGKQKEGKEKPVRNDRFIVVSSTACEYDDIKAPGDLPKSMVVQLSEFFTTYNMLEGRTFKLLGVEGPKAALKLIKAAKLSK